MRGIPIEVGPDEVFVFLNEEVIQPLQHVLHGEAVQTFVNEEGKNEIGAGKIDYTQMLGIQAIDELAEEVLAETRERD